MTERRVVAALAATITLAAGAVWGIGTSNPDPGESISAPMPKGYGRLPLTFEANRGQIDGAFRYLARGEGVTTLLGPLGATFWLSSPGLGRRGAVVAMELIGARAPTAEGVGRLPGTVNYLRGPDPSGWHTGIPTYERVRYRDVYPGTDLVFRGSGRQLEYDFVIAPGADPGAIGLAFDGTWGLRLTSDGDLVIETAAGDLVHRAPTIYQVIAGRRVGIPGSYVLEAGRVGFDVRSYDPELPLVIDPVVMIYSTFLGGSDVDKAFDIAVDDGGAAYITGYTADTTTEYPTTPGAFDPTHNNSNDAFVTKLAPDGRTLVYSTFLGGGVDDYGFDIAVDAAGAAYVVGSTDNAVVDFPTTPGAYDESHNGSFDAFVTKLAPSGASLIYSTLLGGTGSDIAFGLAIQGGGGGSAFITGETQDGTTDFPTTPGAYDESHNGQVDAFVTKLASSGASLDYSTFLGGDAYDQGIGVAIDVFGGGEAYVTGRTVDGTTDLPTTSGAYDVSHNGGSDAFVTKLAPSGASLSYSTFLGGAGFDSGNRVVVSGGSAYVTGRTGDAATDFPTTPGAYDEVHNGSEDAFVTKLAPSGASLTFSTFLGGDLSDSGRGIALDEDAGSAWVIGRAVDGATDWPTTPGGLDTSHNGMADAVLTKLTPSGGGLEYSTFLGGSGFDTGWGVAVDAVGAVYLAGEAPDAVTDYPTTAGAFDTTPNGSIDAFVTKLADPGTCRGKPVTILGTLSEDTLVGTSGPDVFSALDGEDLLKGLGGKDTACAGEGNDVVKTGAGSDTASGGAGNDLVAGGPGRDRLFGDQGKDRLKGAGGNDRMNGGPGKDTCSGGGGKDKAPKCEKERSVP